MTATFIGSSMEAWMSKIVVAALAGAVLVATSALAQAQSTASTGQTPETLGEAASKALIDRRIEVIKVALGLTPDQAKLWPAVEDAIRARLTARHARLASLARRANAPGEANPIELMRSRADALTQRGAALKKLADAWQPLLATLDENQKLRLQFLAAYVLREMGDAVQSRLMASEDEYEVEWE